MKNDIITKLNNHLCLGIKQESDVVYTFVQIRKIMELEKTKDHYPKLDLYSDWVLHTHIDRAKKTGQILNNINLAIVALEDPDGVDYPRAIANINEAISLAKLYQEMKTFFAINNLNKEIFTQDKWKDFAGLLVNVLRDVPLIASGKPLNLVDHFSYAEGLDISHLFRVRIQLPNQRVYHGPIKMLGTDWAVGVSAVSPSAASELEEDLMLKGTIIENSLADKSILKDLEITKTYQSGNWVMHDVLVSEEQAEKLGSYLDEGP